MLVHDLLACAADVQRFAQLWAPETGHVMSNLKGMLTRWPVPLERHMILHQF